MGDFGQSRLRHLGGEPLHHIIAGMHLHDERRARSHGSLEVRTMGAVGGAHLHQLAPRPRHDVGHPEGAADFDQFAARNRHLPAQCQ